MFSLPPVFLLNYNPKGPRTQIIGFEGPNAINIIVFGPQSPVIWVLGPLDPWFSETIMYFLFSLSSSSEIYMGEGIWVVDFSKTNWVWRRGMLRSCLK